MSTVVKSVSVDSARAAGSANMVGKGKRVDHVGVVKNHVNTVSGNRVAWTAAGVRFANTVSNGRVALSAVVLIAAPTVLRGQMLASVHESMMDTALPVSSESSQMIHEAR